MPNSATIVHAKVSTKPAPADSSIIGGPDWNTPHVLTGLDQVDNTSDANKPVSTAQATADALVASNAASATATLTTAVALKAPIASPAFTGVPTAATAAASTNNTQLATTAYADGAVSTLSGTVTTALAAKAPLASPALTGTPTAPTATVGTNTTQLATTAFVLANGSGTRVLLNTLTASSSTTLFDTTSITNTYNEYEIVFENITPATNNVTLNMQVHAAGSFQSTNYNSNILAFAGTASAVASLTTVIQLSDTTVSSTAARGVSGYIKMYGNQASGNVHAWEGRTVHRNQVPTITSAIISGQWESGTAVDGFQISFNTGAIANGVLKVYGLL